jgi:hypothetical protein
MCCAEHSLRCFSGSAEELKLPFSAYLDAVEACERGRLDVFGCSHPDICIHLSQTNGHPQNRHINFNISDQVQ